MTEREIASVFADSSAALNRMRAVAVVDWEKAHGHDHGTPCSRDCPGVAEAERLAEEIRNSIISARPESYIREPASTQYHRHLWRRYGRH